MPKWRSSFWLGAASIYAISAGAAYAKRWEDLAFWTRAHASLDLCTGFWMLVGALALVLVRTGVRPLVVVSAGAAALLGSSLILGTLFGTLPCDGGG